MRTKTVTYTLPAYWASYLINGDHSGLDPKDKLEADDWLRDHGNPRILTCSDEASFAASNDANHMGGDVLDYVTLIIEK